jgi:hypothetical protein
MLLGQSEAKMSPRFAKGWGESVHFRIISWKLTGVLLGIGSTKTGVEWCLHMSTQKRGSKVLKFDQCPFWSWHFHALWQSSDKASEVQLGWNQRRMLGCIPEIFRACYFVCRKSVWQKQFARAILVRSHNGMILGEWVKIQDLQNFQPINTQYILIYIYNYIYTRIIIDHTILLYHNNR